MSINYSTKAFESKYTYSGNDLGAVWTSELTRFRVWAPEAEQVLVVLYESGDPSSQSSINTYEMLPSVKGTWVQSIEGNLSGLYYTYKVCRNGKWAETIDPYARACGINGLRGMILNPEDANPIGWLSDPAPSSRAHSSDNSIYELHIRDITVDSSSRIHHKAKFLGLTESGSTTEHGKPTGLDYIRSLGVTHIQLMPVYDFGSIDERVFSSQVYNWGYDPQNYNIPEGSYATDPYNGYCRIHELKKLILTLHEAGLSVVMDVVYNHVYHSDEFSINTLLPGYFCRSDKHGKLSNASGCGNDTATERSMVRKFIVDSVNYWADEYHIDGFRFDLAGLLDTDTIAQIISSVHLRHPHVLFYGEGWDMPSIVTKKGTHLMTQQNADVCPEFGFFNDSIRDLVRGSVFYLDISGFASGNPVNQYQAFDAFCGRTSWTDKPAQLINYVSCHDNHTLYDRIAISLPNAGRKELAARCRLAAAFNILSMGTPFFQSGEELLRSKKNSSGIPIDNSYNLPDSINAIQYSSLSDLEVSSTLAYYRGLLELRHQHTLFQMKDPAQIRRSISILPSGNPSLYVFRLEDSSERLCVLYNISSEKLPFLLPDGDWVWLANNDLVTVTPIGSSSGTIIIPETSACVLQQRRQN